MTTEKIAILGTAPLSLDLAPFDDPAWTIWACSPGNAYGRLRRVTEWYELHALREMTAIENRPISTPYYAWLRAQQFPVWMQERNEYVPQACVYPLEGVMKRFGRNWLSSSIAFMIAHAIMRGAKEIAIFGVDMAHETEHYSAQKSGCIRFIEIAKEAGLTVHVPDESCLGRQPPIYGYNEATHMGRRFNAMKSALMNQRANVIAQQERLALERANLDGALSQMEYTIRTWVDGADAIERLSPEQPVAIPPRMDQRFDDYTKVASGLIVPKTASVPIENHEQPRSRRGNGAAATETPQEG